MTEEEKSIARYTYQKRKLLQCCVKCGKQDAFTLIGKTTCAECNETQRKCDAKRNAERSEEYKEAKRQKRQEAKANGICTTCLKRTAMKGYAKCEKCRAAYIRYNKKRSLNSNKLSASEAYYCGLCMQCRKKPHMEGRKQCPECYEKARQNALRVNANKDRSRHPWREQDRLLWGGGNNAK